MQQLAAAGLAVWQPALESHAQASQAQLVQEQSLPLEQAQVFLALQAQPQEQLQFSQVHSPPLQQPHPGAHPPQQAEVAELAGRTMVAALKARAAMDEKIEIIGNSSARLGEKPECAV